MNKQKLIELRCKAWGITEDEYYCNQCSDFSLEDMARAYRRGKNKGARDKAIQNVGFYQKQMQDIYDKKNKQIAELEDKLTKKVTLESLDVVSARIKGLEKENSELKEINEGYCRNRDRLISIGFPNFKDCKEYAEQLTNAKDLLKKLLVHSKRYLWIADDNNKPVMQKEIAEAEQFIKDLEK